jgi:monofunctional biosynthetic peptidoglycan transglycosylase
MFRRLLTAVPLAILGAAWFYWVTIPWPLRLRIHDPQSSAVMRQRAAEARSRGEAFELQRAWVPLDRISPRVRRAVIAAEDGRFHQHNGIDWDALREEFRYRGDDSFSLLDADDRRHLRAAWRYFRENRHRIRGRSTITQQVAKNLYYSTDRSTLRKLEEFIVARRLEAALDKDRILEIYLNIAELGPGIFGVEAAARHYFDRTAANLTADQAAALAATLPHPLSSNPRHNPRRMYWRKELILARMGGTGPVQTVPLETDTLSVPRDDEPAGMPPPPADTAAVPPVGDTLPLPPAPPAPAPPVDTARPPVPPPDTVRAP